MKKDSVSEGPSVRKKKACEPYLLQEARTVLELAHEADLDVHLPPRLCPLGLRGLRDLALERPSPVARGEHAREPHVVPVANLEGRLPPDGPRVRRNVTAGLVPSQGEAPLPIRGPPSQNFGPALPGAGPARPDEARLVLERGDVHQRGVVPRGVAALLLPALEHVKCQVADVPEFDVSGETLDLPVPAGLLTAQVVVGPPLEVASGGERGRAARLPLRYGRTLGVGKDPSAPPARDAEPSFFSCKRHLSPKTPTVTSANCCFSHTWEYFNDFFSSKSGFLIVSTVGKRPRKLQDDDGECDEYKFITLLCHDFTT